MSARHQPPRLRAKPARVRPGWLTIGLLGLGVLFLHLVALAWLGAAFSPWARGRLPEPIYTRLLKPAPVMAHPSQRTAPPRPAPAPKPSRVAPPPQAAPVSVPKTETPSPPPPRQTLLADAAQAVPTPAPQTRAPPPPAPAPSAAVASSLGDEASPGALSQPGAGLSSRAPGSVAPPVAPLLSASHPASYPLGNAAPAPPRAWPPSTRLSYTITGYWRGALHGSGALVWTVDGDHYEATLSGHALIGFAYRSIGRIDGHWLAPSHYTERLFTREKSVRFDRGDDTLHFSASPDVVPLPPHVQDSASLFLQLASRLTRHPEAFHPGATLTFDVARPSGMTRWTFTVAGMETVATPAGPLSCWHIVRHAADPNQLGAQIWLSPQMQNLPVQIRLQHSADSYLLFTLDHAEQQAPPQSPASAAP
ncbi:DUF3108 domain-containing protein [Thiomonas intermedia]|uniref:DUF3108 domain-containing protein n=1 Tax=Thiomonas intermedia TaxID=926 RepID=UPI0009A51433|nr:DUF3108 domain-containing protein [Thiomonas intermedia]